METMMTKILLKLRKHHNLDATKNQIKIVMEVILAPHQFQVLKREPCRFKRNENTVPSNDIEYKLLKSANDPIKGDNANQDSPQAFFAMNDEGDLFCARLAKRMKKINHRSRGNLRVQTEHLKNQTGFLPPPIP